MHEERIFFGEARRRDLAVFWKVVEERQAIGRKIRAALEQVRRTAAADPVPGEGIGALRPAMWSDFVDFVGQALERPDALATRHCARLDGPVDCPKKLALYLHSIGADADELDVWRMHRLSLGRNE